MFPGQGAQYVGMGKELANEFPQAKELYDTANQILGYDIKKLCFEGPSEQLVQTKNSQPAILATSVACLQVLKAEIPEIIPTGVCGLSLGEYTSLVCVGAIEFDNALRLVSKRASFMQEASESSNGGMLSIIGVTEDEVRSKLQDKADIANLNCPGQVVVSAGKDQMEHISSLFKKVIPLDVSGPFHSRFMESAREKLKPLIMDVKINEPSVTFIANVNGVPVKEPYEIKECLIKQVSSSVYWEKSIRSMIALGIDTFIEIGPGKVLGGILRRIDRKLKYFNIENIESLKAIPRPNIHGIS